MHIGLHHGINHKTIRIRFFVDDAHFASAEPSDGSLLAVLAGYEFIWRFQGFSNLVRIDFPLDHPLFGVMGICDAHRSTSLSQFVRDHSFCTPALLYRKSHALARPPLTSISLHHRDLRLRQPIQLVHQLVDLLVRGLDLALEHGLDVRRLFGCELFVQI